MLPPDVICNVPKSSVIAEISKRSYPQRSRNSNCPADGVEGDRAVEGISGTVEDDGRPAVGRETGISVNDNVAARRDGTAVGYEVQVAKDM